MSLSALCWWWCAHCGECQPVSCPPSLTPTLAPVPTGVPARLARCPILGLGWPCPWENVQQVLGTSSTPGPVAFPGISAACTERAAPRGGLVLQMRFYILHLVKKRRAHSGTDNNRKLAQDILFFLLSIHPTHPHVCPDTSCGTDTACKRGGATKKQPPGSQGQRPQN